MAASRAPTTRGVRSVPSAVTSVGDAMPPGVTSMPPTAKLDVVLDQRGERGGGRRVGQQGGERRRGERGRLEQRLGQAGAAPPPRARRRGRRRSGRDRSAASGTTSAGAPSSASTAQRFSRQLGSAGFVGQLEGAERVDACTRCRAPCARPAQLLLLVGEGEVHVPSRSAARQPEQALGHHVALDLVGPGVDRPGQREEVAVEPLARARRPRAARPRGRAGRGRRCGWPRRSRTRRSCCSSPPGPPAWPRATLVAVQ